MRRDRERLRDILAAIQQIGRHAPDDREAFEADELVFSFVIQQIQIIGEAAGAVSTRVRREHPEVPWSEIVGMRNAVVHGYFSIKADRVWAVVQDDLSLLEAKVGAILEQLPED